MSSPDSESQPRTLKETALLFLGGSGAGLIVFILGGAAWDVSHFWWVMAAVTLSCGLLAVLLRQRFEKLLTGLLDNAPWF